MNKAVLAGAAAVGGLVLFNLALDMHRQDRIAELESRLQVEEAVSTHVYINLRGLQQNQHLILETIRSELAPKKLTPLCEPLNWHDSIPKKGKEE